MAFKINFDAINNRTPEQRRADEMQRYERLRAMRQALVDERSGKVAAVLSRLSDNFVGASSFEISPDGVKFIRDLEYKMTTFDSDGLMGGGLADLTVLQGRYLDGLFDRAAESVPHARP